MNYNYYQLMPSSPPQPQTSIWWKDNFWLKASNLPPKSQFSSLSQLTGPTSRASSSWHARGSRPGSRSGRAGHRARICLGLGHAAAGWLWRHPACWSALASPRKFAKVESVQESALQHTYIMVFHSIKLITNKIFVAERNALFPEESDKTNTYMPVFLWNTCDQKIVSIASFVYIKHYNS